MFLKPWRDRWGLSKNELDRSFPGDEYVTAPKSHFTHAVEINAPAEFVWPWIAQLGQGRGGFYSYEALENLMGMHIYNSDVVLPEFQNPKIGDLIPFSSNDAYPLVVVEPGKGMVIENWYDLDADKDCDLQMAIPKNYLHLSWAWYVERLDAQRSRFISRNRVDYSPSLKGKLLF